jgi:solute carrier family 35, member F1/2
VTNSSNQPVPSIIHFMPPPDIPDSLSKHKSSLHGVDLFDHSRTRPENFAKGISTASFASISISGSAMYDQETRDDPNAPQRPLATMRGVGKKAITISEDSAENDESSLLSNDDFGGASQSASSKVSILNDDQTIAQMTLASLEDALRYAVAHWKIVVFGQFISFLSASAGASQATLSHKCDLNAPAFSSALMYLGLTIFIVPLYVRRRREAADEGMRGASIKPIHTLFGIPTYEPVWKYVGASFLHFYANYFVVLAFRFTSLTSIMLLDVLALPSSMILSVIFLKRQYVSIHFLGATVCMMGIVFNVLADYELDLVVKTEFPNRLLGDIIAGLGTVLYGTNNVIKESFVRGSGGPSEYLGCVGLLGTMWATAHAMLFERQDIANFFNGGGNCPVAAGGILMFLFAKSKGLKFFCSAHFLTISESALLNLSILTSDFWAVAFSIFAQHILPSPLFWVAVTFTISGVIIYEIAPSPIVPEQYQPHQYRQHTMNDTRRRGSKSLRESHFI